MTPTLRRQALLPLLALLLVVPLLHVRAAHADGAASTELVSRSSSDVPSDADGGPGWYPGGSISDDGRFVVFASQATNLVDDDTNDVPDLFIRDRQANTIERVNLHPDGGEAAEEAYSGVVSGDGSTVVFISEDLDLAASTSEPDVEHVYRWTRSTGDIERVDDAADGASRAPDVSDDGRYVVFASEATNLVAGTDANGSGTDVYRKDMETGTVVRVSVSTSGTQLVAAQNPKVSDDGNLVLFNGFDGGNHPVLRDITGETTIDAVPGAMNLAADEVDFSGYGNQIAFRAQNAQSEWFLDVATPGSTATAVLGPLNALTAATLSDDGRYVSFVTDAQLVAADDDGEPDVYRMDLTDQSQRLVSPPPEIDTIVPSSPVISGTGEHVLFVAYDPSLPGHANWYVRGSLGDPDGAPEEPTTTTTTEPASDPAACQWEWGGLQEPDPQPCHEGNEIALSASERSPSTSGDEHDLALVALGLLAFVGWKVLEVTRTRLD